MQNSSKSISAFHTTPISVKAISIVMVILILFLTYMTLGQLVPLSHGTGYIEGNLLDNTSLELVLQGVRALKTWPGVLGFLFSIVITTSIVLGVSGAGE